MTRKWPADQVERRKVADLVPYVNNARTHSDAQVEQIAKSIGEFGWTVPVLIDPKGGVIAGHGRILAAQKLGLEDVPCMVARGWTAAQKRAYVIADNKIAENAGWDENLLNVEFAALRDIGFDMSLTGFGLDEIGSILETAADIASADDAEDAVDDTPATPSRPVSRPGDLWVLGNHRLLCGDSTDADAVARLLNGERASLLFTSPPYSDQRDYTTGGIGNWETLMRGVFRHLGMLMAGDGQVLVNLGIVHRKKEWMPYWQTWLDWMRDQGWRRFGLYVWDQGPGLPGDWSGRLAPAFELLFHFNRQSRQPNKIVPSTFAGAPLGGGGLRSKDGHIPTKTGAGNAIQSHRIPDSVVRVVRQKGAVVRQSPGHPAPFPVALPEFVMQAYSERGDIVCDPFSGAGTTIVAGERSGRLVRAIELAPEYVDVALLRWRRLFPEKKVTLDGREEEFESIAKERGVDPCST